MSDVSNTYQRHDSCFLEYPSLPFSWLGSRRSRFLHIRDRIVPWQLRHFYYRHKGTVQASTLLGLGLLLSGLLTPLLQLYNDLFKGYFMISTSSIQLGSLFVPGLKAFAHRITLPRGKRLYEEAQPAHEVMFLVEGYGRLCVAHEKDRHLTVGLVCPGDLFGEEALLDAPERESSFEAVLHSEVDVISLEDFTAYVSNHPETLRAIMEHLAQRLLSQQRHMIRLAFEPLEQRLAWILLELASASGTGSDQEPTIPIYHKNLAAVLGVWRETITATLNHWSSEGLIAQRPGHIILKDVARLKHLTEEGN